MAPELLVSASGDESSRLSAQEFEDFMVKVLVVDDEPHVIEILEPYLSSRGYSVFTAGDGQEAAEVFAREKPASVLLDLSMPGADGLSVLDWIRSQDEIVTVIVAGCTDEEARNGALERGADDYLVKPIDHDSLERTLHWCLKLQQACRARF